MLAPPAQQAAGRRGQAAHRAQGRFEGRVHRSSASTVSGETEGLGIKVSLNNHRYANSVRLRRILNLTARPAFHFHAPFIMFALPPSVYSTI